MSKARKCDWCGEGIGEKEERVRVPVQYDAPPFAYHVKCYCRIFDKECLRYLVTDDDVSFDSVGRALRKVLDALDRREPREYVRTARDDERFHDDD